MSFFKKNKILVTHDGSFHADDIFATATLSIVFDGRIKVIRTRDIKLIESADVVYDVGGIYNSETNRFDHHQVGGAGTRDDGVPYSSFGLIWKKYGEEICGSKEVAKRIEGKVVESIDANDNGVNLFEVKGKIAPYTIQDIFYNFRPTWKEEQDYYKPFMELVSFAKRVIIQEVESMKASLEAESIVIETYEKSEDKRVIIFDRRYPWLETIDKLGEALFVVSSKDGLWRAEAVPREKYSFEVKKQFPESWAGKRDEEMVKETGVPDAVFCHSGRFLVVARSKEGIIELVKKALLA